jgi:hypothetical protein
VKQLPEDMHLNVTLYNLTCHRIITVTILDVIRRLVWYLKYGVSDIEFCLRLQLKLTQVGPIERASLCLHAEYSHVSTFSLMFCIEILIYFISSDSPQFLGLFGGLQTGGNA